MTFATNYQKWLAGGSTDRALVETMQISHDDMTTVYVANWDRDITCELEDVAGTPNQLFSGSRFILDRETVGDTFDQTTTLTIATPDGTLYEAINAIPKYDPDGPDRRTPISITVRLYLSNALTGVGSLLINPPPVWTVHAITAVYTGIRADLQAVPLRDRRVGLYYLQNKFPILTVIN